MELANAFIYEVPRLHTVELKSFDRNFVWSSPLLRSVAHLDIRDSDATVSDVLAGLRSLAQLERVASLRHISIEGPSTALHSKLLQHLSFPPHTTVRLCSGSIDHIAELLHKARSTAAPVIAPSSFNAVHSVEMAFTRYTFHMRCFDSDNMSLESDCKDVSYDFSLDDQHPFELSGNVYQPSAAEIIGLVCSSPLSFSAVTAVLISGITSPPPWSLIFNTFRNLQVLWIYSTPLDNLVDDLTPRAGNAKDPGGVVVLAPSLKKLDLREVTFADENTLWGAISCTTEVEEWLIYDPIRDFVDMLNARAAVNAALHSLVLQPRHKMAESDVQRIRQVVPCEILANSNGSSPPMHCLD
ncbi:hypothetical protein F5I97DRAFT_1094725 [Phlebopus sp. FC_14]|nr:hypothetical protein F5I97DRAFT_1094725 [Phlebopus sp. FC_14]